MRRALTAAVALLTAGCPDFDRAHQQCVAAGKCFDRTDLAIAPEPVRVFSALGGVGRARVTVSNGGAFATGPLAIESNDPVFRLEKNGCLGTALAAGGSCSVDVTFSSGIVEQRLARLSVSASPGGFAFAQLSGESRAAATLTLDLEGAGLGEIDLGFDRCSRHCVVKIPEGVPLTLVATAAPGSRFEGWSGACSGPEGCTLADPRGDLFVSARMATGLGRLTVDVDLDGGTQVDFTPDGAPCGPACRGYMGVTAVDVVVRPAPGRGVASWSGCQSTSGPTCRVTVAGDITVRAQLQPPHVAFVSSAAVLPGSLNGPLGADAFCQSLATDAGLPGRFVAWVSTVNSAARTRIGEGVWVRPDGVLVARALSRLVKGELYAPIRLDERGRDVGALRVATGTDYEGALNVFRSNCADWTGASGSLLFGGSAWVDENWTWGTIGFDTASDPGCSRPAHFYCFGAGTRIELPEPMPRPGRVAFVTERELTGALGGVAGADAVCASEAGDAGLTGTFFAALATAAAPLAERFAGLDGGWSRVDGLELGDTAVLAAGRWPTGLMLDARGRALQGAPVWSGATAWSSGDGGTCSDWTTDAGRAGVLRAGNTMPFVQPDPLDFNPARSCASTARLWCFGR